MFIISAYNAFPYVHRVRHSFVTPIILTPVSRIEKTHAIMPASSDPKEAGMDKHSIASCYY